MEPHEQKRFDELTRQVHVLQRQVAFLTRHLGVNYVDAPPAQQEDDVTRLILAGDKIGAIRRHCEKTGASLVEAKDYVNQLASRLGR